MAPRPPPIAMRVAISRVRAAARASSRPAMFAQPISSTTPTAAQTMSRGCRRPAAAPFLKAGDAQPRPVGRLVASKHRPSDAGQFLIGRRARRARPQARDDAVVAAFAFTRQRRLERRPEVGAVPVVKAGGITPTTVCGSPFRVTRRPIASALPLERALPERVAEDDGRRAAGAILVSRELAADARRQRRARGRSRRPRAAAGRSSRSGRSRSSRLAPSR